MNYSIWIFITSMGRLKHRLLFYGLSFSAYFSPIVMIISILTNYWLFSVERITNNGQSDTTITTKPTTTTTTTTLNSQHLTMNTTHSIHIQITTFSQSNSTSTISSTRKTYESLGYIEASYGLWQVCKIMGKFSRVYWNFTIVLTNTVFLCVIDVSFQKYCEYINYFQVSDSDTRLTDLIKSKFKNFDQFLIYIVLK